MTFILTIERRRKGNVPAAAKKSLFIDEREIYIYYSNNLLIYSFKNYLKESLIFLIKVMVSMGFPNAFANF
jgi:hypothetical protein